MTEQLTLLLKKTALKVTNKDQGFPDGSVVKNPPSSAGDMGLVPESGRSSGEENGNSLQYSCLEKSLAGYSPWTEDSGRLQSMGSQKSQTRLTD